MSIEQIIIVLVFNLCFIVLWYKLWKNNITRFDNNIKIWPYPLERFMVEDWKLYFLARRVKQIQDILKIDEKF